MWTGHLLMACMLFPLLCYADDAYYLIPLSELDSAGALSKALGDEFTFSSRFWRAAEVPPQVSVDVGEAFESNNGQEFSDAARLKERAAVVVRAPQGKKIHGVLAWNPANGKTAPPLSFDLDPTKAGDFRQEFENAKQQYYRQMINLQFPGAPWFRHCVGKTAPENSNDGIGVLRSTRRRGLWGTDPMDLFTGGRAFAENLQLDRELRARKEDSATVDAKSLKGITIAEIDWKQFPAAAEQDLDPLAKYVPRDQHVLFCKSLGDFLSVLDEFQRTSGKMLELTQPTSVDYGVGKRYETQLGTPPSEIARTVGKQLVESVAVTGSDLYFEQGTDLAILFETKAPQVFAKLLEARILISATQMEEMSQPKGKFGSAEYVGFVTPGSELRSYVACLPNAVVLTNSLVQLQRLAELPSGESLAELADYRFFRQRYARSATDETGLVFISDPAIRRWCSPAARIGKARRQWALAELAERQTAEIERQISGDTGTKIESSELLGNLTRTSAGLRSERYNTLAFQTPLCELTLDKVTKAEAGAYESWRQGYESNWNWRFDPIGLKLTILPDKFAADVTVMPLIAGTSYREMISVTRGGKLLPLSADPHEVFAQLAIAIKPESEPVRQAGSFLAGAMMRQNPALDWLGNSLTVYADQDPLWDELAKYDPDNHAELAKFFQANFQKLPWAVRIEAASTPKLLLFLTAARTFIEQSGPGMTTWGTESLGEHTVTKVTMRERLTPNEQFQPSIYYAVMNSSVVISPNLPLIERAFSRAQERAKPDFVAPLQTWIGENVGLVVRPRDISIWTRLLQSQFSDEYRLAAWRNLPILNEWKRLFPKEDPVAVHQRLWSETLVDPSGGTYVWNEQYQTMESTAWGHPAAPKFPAVVAATLDNIRRGQFGLTFEQQGLRARFELDRQRREEGSPR
jgi:hypothetical protein